MTPLIFPLQFILQSIVDLFAMKNNKLKKLVTNLEAKLNRLKDMMELITG